MRSRITMPVLLMVFGAILLLALHAQAKLDSPIAQDQVPVDQSARP
ncbi:MAG: hypothetical protein VYE15_08100 [Myxococcota bacterium]|nr:hypothetical protein [Myxococcota bacterium]